MRRVAFSQEEVTEIQDSIVKELDVIQNILAVAFNEVSAGKDKKRILNTIYSAMQRNWKLKSELEEDIKIEATPEKSTASII